MRTAEVIEKVGDETIKIQFSHFEQSMYIWVAQGEADISMRNLSLFFGSSNSTILGTSDQFTISLGTKLSNKLKKPLYLSINRDFKRELMNEELNKFIEKAVFAHLNNDDSSATHRK